MTKEELFAFSAAELTVLPAVDLSREAKAWTNVYCVDCGIRLIVG